MTIYRRRLTFSLALIIFTSLFGTSERLAAAAMHADLSLSMVPSVRTNLPGAVRLNVTLENLGPDPAGEVSLWATTTAGVARFEGCDSAANSNCSILLLQDRRTRSVTLVIEEAPSEGTFDVEVRASSPIDDPDPTNNKARTPVEVTRAPSVDFFFSQPGPADPGKIVEYEVTITNNSPFDATRLTFSFTLPEGWSYESALSDELRCSSEGQVVLCMIDRLAGTVRRPFRFRLRAPSSRAGSHSSQRVRLTTAQGTFRDVSSGTLTTLTLASYRTLEVSTVLDSGEGSLREAILTANRESIPPLINRKIVFEIPPDGSPIQTIQPLTPLPPVTNFVLIDGTSQTTRFSDSNPEGPEIELNGSRVTGGDGLEFRIGFTLRGLTINGFPGNGISLSRPGGATALIQECHIGTDATGRHPVPNALRGVLVTDTKPLGFGGTSFNVIELRDNVISGNGRSGVFVTGSGGMKLTGNRIGAAAGPMLVPLGNGASGVYFGPGTSTVLVRRNIIAFNAHAGIAIDREASFIEMRSNSIVENGSLGIDHGLDGVTANVPSPYPVPNHPVITSARYDAASGTTEIIGNAGNETVVELFASSLPDPSRFGEGELFVGSVGVNGPAFKFVSRLDLRGRFLTATATRTLFDFDVIRYATSEMGAAFRVEGAAAGSISRDLRRRADLSLEISGGPEIVIRVRNLGPAAAENVHVDLTADRAAGFDGLHPACSGNGSGSVRCVIPRLDPGEVVTLTALLKPPPQTPSVSVAAVVSSTIVDPDQTNNTGLLFIASPSFSLSTAVRSPGPADPGGLATYEVRVTNRGPAAADVVVTIPLAPGWSLHSPPVSAWTCRLEGPSVVCRRASVAADTTETFHFTLLSPDTPSGGSSTTRTITTAGSPAVSVFDAVVTYETYRILEVTTTADLGEGTLRTAITRASTSLAGISCRIIFNIPFLEAREGVFTIQPRTPLPPLGRNPFSGEISIDGRTQTVRTGDTNAQGPEIEVSGVLQSQGSGLQINCPKSTIRGLVLNGFPTDGIVVLPNAGLISIADNYIGTDTTGRIALPNRRRGISTESGLSQLKIVSNVISGNGRSAVYVPVGQDLRISGNRIGLSSGVNPRPLPNGASGIYIGPVFGSDVNSNAISHNREAGIALARNAFSELRGNSMVGNGGLGIDYGIDGVTFNDEPARPASLPHYPLLLSARWEESTQSTRIEGTIQKSFGGGTVELFRNGMPDESGFGECEELLGDVTVAETAGTKPFSILIPRDLRGSFVTATWTAGTNFTSEISAAIKVE